MFLRSFNYLCEDAVYIFEILSSKKTLSTISSEALEFPIRHRHKFESSRDFLDCCRYSLCCHLIIICSFCGSNYHHFTSLQDWSDAFQPWSALEDSTEVDHDLGVKEVNFQLPNANAPSPIVIIPQRVISAYRIHQPLIM